MKSVIQHERLGEITYEESAWTGKKTLSINGHPLDKTAKNMFRTYDGETIELKGNFFRGTKAFIGTETIILTAPCKWYEYVLAALPFILIMIWGNSPALCAIIPAVGGAIGGLIAALFVVGILAICRKVKNVFLKILIAIVMTGLCFLVCYLIALAMLAALQA